MSLTVRVGSPDPTWYMDCNCVLRYSHTHDMACGIYAQVSKNEISPKQGKTMEFGRGGDR